MEMIHVQNHSRARSRPKHLAPVKDRRSPTRRKFAALSCTTDMKRGGTAGNR